MAKFTDRKGREWEIDLTVGLARRLKKDGVSLYALEEDKAEKLKSLLANREEALEWVWNVIKPQAVAAGVSEDDFFDNMDGKPSADARRAFLDSYGNFTQSQAIQSMIRGQIDLEVKAETSMSRATAKMMEIAANEFRRQDSTINDENISKMFADVLKTPAEKSQTNSHELQATT